MYRKALSAMSVKRRLAALSALLMIPLAVIGVGLATSAASAQDCGVDPFRQLPQCQDQGPQVLVRNQTNRTMNFEITQGGTGSRDVAPGGVVTIGTATRGATLVVEAENRDGEALMAGGRINVGTMATQVTVYLHANGRISLRQP